MNLFAFQKFLPRDQLDVICMGMNIIRMVNNLRKKLSATPHILSANRNKNAIQRAQHEQINPLNSNWSLCCGMEQLIREADVGKCRRPSARGCALWRKPHIPAGLWPIYQHAKSNDCVILMMAFSRHTLRNHRGEQLGRVPSPGNLLSFGTLVQVQGLWNQPILPVAVH